MRRRARGRQRLVLEAHAVAEEAIIVKNRRASFDYALEDRFEGGLVLLGSEVKSLRAGRVDLTDAFATVKHGEVWLEQMNVPPLPQAASFPHDARRARKVLLHGHEIERIKKETSRGGFTLIPTQLYFKGGRVKVELALAKGKKKVDKREDIAAKTARREAREAVRGGRGSKG
jgi:SsrA-binding protein